MVTGAAGCQAVIPDQLTHYVEAVGMPCVDPGPCPLYMLDGAGVLAAYPPADPASSELVDAEVARALQCPDLKQLTVLAAVRPAAAPEHAVTHRDRYWQLELPAAPSSKTRNMLARGAREAEVTGAFGKSAWTAAHAELVEDFCRRKGNALDSATVYLYQRIESYLAANADVRLFSAYLPEGRLTACAVADYSAISRAFYMFAFRAADSPPGVADLLLAHIAEEAGRRGYASLNLGLGINSGVEFFKKKWNARPYLPYVETTWRKKGFWARLLGRS